MDKKEFLDKERSNENNMMILDSLLFELEIYDAKDLEEIGK